MSVSKRILLDVDGVLADFVGPVLREINARTGGEFKMRDIHSWDIYQSLGVTPEVGRLVDNVIKQPGFCEKLAPYPGASKFLEVLRAQGEVIAVTSPFDSDHWIPERIRWLQARGFSRKDIVFTDRKELVSGDYLIDDKASTLVTWTREQGTGGILFTRPWNIGENADDFYRANSYEGVAEIIEEAL